MGHVCEPDCWPTAITDRWLCPVCETPYDAYDPAEDAPSWLTCHIPPGTLGWCADRCEA